MLQCCMRRKYQSTNVAKVVRNDLSFFIDDMKDKAQANGKLSVKHAGCLSSEAICNGEISNGLHTTHTGSSLARANVGEVVVRTDPA